MRFLGDLVCSMDTATNGIKPTTQLPPLRQLGSPKTSTNCSNTVFLLSHPDDGKETQGQQLTVYACRYFQKLVTVKAGHTYTTQRKETPTFYHTVPYLDDLSLALMRKTRSEILP